MSLIDNTIYYGKTWNVAYLEAFYNSKLLNWNMADLMPSVNGTVHIPVIKTLDAGIRAFTCTPTSAASQQLDDRPVTVCRFQFINEYCKSDLDAKMTQAGVFQENMDINPYPPEFLNLLVESQLNAVSQQLDQIILQGDTSLPSPAWLNVCDGLFKKWNADADVVKVASPVALTVNNVLGELRRLYLAADPLVTTERVYMNNPDVFIAVSPATLSLINAALELGSYTNYPAYSRKSFTTVNKQTIPDVLHFHSIPIIPIFGNKPITGTDNIMWLTYAKNIILATYNYVGGNNIGQMQIYDMEKGGLGPKISMQGYFNLGNTYIFPELITTYGI